MRKKIIASVLALGLVAGIAYAHSGGYGMGGHGNGGHMMNHGQIMGNSMGNGHMMNGGYNMMGHHMRGSGGYANCPGAAASGNNGWDSASHQKFLDETVELRKEMNNKRFEYMETRRNPNASRDQLAAIEKEFNDIQLKLQQKAQQYR